MKKMIPHQNPSLYGVCIVLLGALFYFYEYFLRISPGIMKTDLMQYYHLDATLFGTLVGFYYYAYSPMQLAVGVILDRYPNRVILTSAIVCCALGSYLFAHSTDFAWAALGRFMQGLGSAFAFVGALKLASRWLPAWWFASFAGLCHAFGLIGGAIGNISLTDLLQHWGWQKLMDSFMVIGFVFAGVMWLGLTQLPKRAPVFQEQSASICTLKEASSALWQLVKTPYIWAAGVLGGLMFLPTIVFADLWGISYFQRFHGYTLSQAGFAIAMIYFGWALGGPCQGILSSVWQKRTRLLFWNALIAAFLAAVLLFWQGLTYPVLCALCFIWGIFSSAEILTFAMARDVSTVKTAGMALALVNFLVMSSGLFMQTRVGHLLDLSWSGHLLNGVRIYTVRDYQRALIAVPVCLLAASVLAFFVKDRRLVN